MPWIVNGREARGGDLEFIPVAIEASTEGKLPIGVAYRFYFLESSSRDMLIEPAQIQQVTRFLLLFLARSAPVESGNCVKFFSHSLVKNRDELANSQRKLRRIKSSVWAINVWKLVVIDENREATSLVRLRCQASWSSNAKHAQQKSRAIILTHTLPRQSVSPFNIWWRWSYGKKGRKIDKKRVRGSGEEKVDSGATQSPA